MDIVGLRVPNEEIRDFSTFNVSNVSRVSPSIRCVTAANKSANLWTFSIDITSPLRIYVFSFA
jgi:hypothetical protein